MSAARCSTPASPVEGPERETTTTSCPIGTTLAHQLAGEGHDVVVVSRSGSSTGDAGVEHRAADIADPGALAEIAHGAAVLYNCVNPPYHRWAQEWPPLHRTFLDAARATGAVLVTASNLYGYGAGSGVMREETPLASTETKGLVRADMWRTALAEHEAGRVRVTEVRASDYLGPLATDNAHYGGRLITPLLAGRTLRPIGNPDLPHSVVFLPDFARTLAVAGTTPTAWGQAWLAPHLPAETYRQVARRFSAAAGRGEPKLAPLPTALLRVAALVSPMMREVQRISYQFTEPFEVDSSRSERELGLEATPWDVVVGATLDWWRASGPRSLEGPRAR